MRSGSPCSGFASPRPASAAAERRMLSWQSRCVIGAFFSSLLGANLVYFLHNLQQALSKAPYNAQLARAYKYCTETETFNFSQLIAGDLPKVIALIPRQEDNGEIVVSKLQAIAKGALVRTGMLLGVGAQKDNARPMTARLGVIMQGRPVLLKVQASWMGKVTHIKVFDVLNSTASKAHLRTPFSPARETGVPRRLLLTMELIQGGSTRSTATQNNEESVEVVLKFTDRDSGVYSYRRMRLKVLEPPENDGPALQKHHKSGHGTPHSLERWGSTVSRPVEIQVEDLNMNEHRSFLDLQPQSSLYRTLLRESSLLSGMPRGPPLSHPVSELASTATFTSAATPVLGVTSIAGGDGQDRSEFGDINPDQYSSLGGYDEYIDLTAVSVTNALTIELVKEGFQWRGRYYLVRVVNEHDVTQVTFMQMHTDRIFVFLMAREHIDRSFSLAKRWAYLMEILENNPATAHLLHNLAPSNVLVSENFSLQFGPSEMFSIVEEVEDTPREPVHDPNPLHLSEEELRLATEALDKPQTIMGKFVYTSLLPRGNGVSVILVDPQNQPIIGSGLEVVDTIADAQPSLSLLRDSVSNKFKDSVSHGIDIDEEESVEAFSKLEFGSAVLANDSGLDVSQSGKHGSRSRDVGDSAYELLGAAAAIPAGGGSGSYALSPEEYEAMVREQSRRQLSLRTDSDMEGLRYGGALDDDSVSQVIGSPDGHFQFFDGASPKGPTAHASFDGAHRVDSNRGDSELDGEQVLEGEEREENRSIPSGQTMQDDALAAFENTMDYINKVADKDHLTAFSLPALTEAPPVIPAFDENRRIVARKSISLGMNLSAALTAALKSGKVPAHSPPPPRRHTFINPTATTHRKKSTAVAKFAPGSPAYQALVSVKAAALVASTMTIAIGSAVVAASSGKDIIPAPPLQLSASVAVDSTLNVIHEDDEASQDSDDDWIAKLFRESFAPDGEVEEGSVVVDLERLAAEASEPAEPAELAQPDEAPVEYAESPVTARLHRSRTRTASDMYSYESSDDEDGPRPLEQVDIEWIVELGSDGAMEEVEEKLVEEVLSEAVKYWSEVFSDQVPGLRDPLVERVLADATESVVDFFVHSAQIAVLELEEVIQTELASVGLVQLVEATAVRNATKSILAAEKAKMLAQRKAAHEEKVRIAAAKAAEEEALAAAELAELQAFQSIVSEDPSVETSTAGGYFVKKIRSHIYGTVEADHPPPLLVQTKSLLDGGASIASSVRPHTTGAGSLRSVSRRDTFTPALPLNLLHGHEPMRPHSHHVQFTSTHGGVVFSPPEKRDRAESPLVAPGLETGDFILDESGVPLHISDNSYDDSFETWESNQEVSLNNYFQLEESRGGMSPTKTRIGSEMRTTSAPNQRSAGEISQHNRQVVQSRRAQNRSKPAEGAAPMWLTLGGAASASLLLPGAESSAVLDHTGGLDSTSMFSTGGMIPVPLPMPKNALEVPLVSMIHTRAQSPAMPAAALPNYAFSTAEGLKQALQQNWDGRTIPKYWGTALKARADERINEPFASKSANAKKQRRAIKAKAAFAAAAAASAVNSNAGTRELVDQQFTSLMDDTEHVHESFFESHVGPFGSVDMPFNNYLRRSDSQGMPFGASNSHILSQQPPLRPSTAPAVDSRLPGGMAQYGIVASNSYVTKVHRPADFVMMRNNTQPRAATTNFDLTAEPLIVNIPSANHTATDPPSSLIPQHTITKGLHHDHGYDASNLLANQVEPPFHHISTRVACRSPPDVAQHFRRSTAAIAEEIDDAMEREEVNDMFRQSLEIYNKIGYVQKLPLPHSTHWVKVVSKYLMSLKSIDELRKRLATLGRSSPRSLTTEESICVLADTNGIVGQAVEKLKQQEYFAEIRLVCRSIHVRNMVHLLEGGEDVYKFKVGEGRPRSSSQDRLSTTWAASEAAYITSPTDRPITPGGGMFAGMDEDMRRAATVVVDPYSPAMVAQHHEVVAHMKIREKYEELKAESSTMESTTDHSTGALPPRAQSARVSGSEKMGFFQRMASQRSVHTSFKSTGGDSQSGHENAGAVAEKEIASLGMFLPPVHQTLTHTSPFVRSRASLVVLSGSDKKGPQHLEEGSQGSLGGPSDEFAPRGHSRSSLRMSVSSPQKAGNSPQEEHVAGGRSRASLRMSVSSPQRNAGHSFMGNGAGSRAGSMNQNNSFMLGAIAAAVAAAEGNEGGEAVVGAVHPMAGQHGRRRTGGGGGSISAGTAGNGSFVTNVRSGSARASFKSTAAQSQRAWRQKSGIFDAATFKLAVDNASDDGSREGSRDGSPSNRNRSPKSARRASASPRASQTTPKSARSPTFRKVSNQTVSFDLYDDSHARGAVETSRDQEEFDEGEDVVIREEDEEVFEEEEDDGYGYMQDATAPVSPPQPMRKQISINPWYLKNQSSPAPAPAPAPAGLPALAPLQIGPPVQSKAPAKLTKQRSYRTETIVEDIFERESLGVAFAVMSRRDAERAAKDETLARSSKGHIRRSVELRAAKFQHAEPH